jgi:predicted transport protein
MSDIKLFRIDGESVDELTPGAHSLEKHLQSFIEKNMEALLSIRFVASEHSTGPVHGGRIDSLGLDENSSPVIVEYKRSRSDNVINQGLFYLDWLMDHKADFQLLVQAALGPDAAEVIDWTGPRLLCIAVDFTRYDEHAVNQMNRNIELLRYRRYGDEFLLLELVNAAAAPVVAAPAAGDSGSGVYKTADQIISENAGTLVGDLWEDLRARILSLGDDVQEKHLKYYVAFKKLSNFVTVEVQKKKIHVYLKLDPGKVALEKGFTRDVSNIGHFGTGDLEVTISMAEDIERAWPLIERSYEAT